MLKPLENRPTSALNKSFHTLYHSFVFQADLRMDAQDP